MTCIFQDTGLEMFPLAEITFNGHSRPLAVSPFDRSHMTSY